MPPAQDQEKPQKDHGKVPEIAVQGQNGKRVVHSCLVREGEKPGQQAKIRQKVREHRAQPGEKAGAPQAQGVRLPQAQSERLPQAQGERLPQA